MARRAVPLVVLAVALGLGLAAPAAGDHSARISSLQARIAAARRHESALRAQIGAVTAQIRSLERSVGDVSQHLATLERDLVLRQRRLERLNALFALETARLERLRREYERIERQLSRRLVQIYESPDPSPIEIVLGARSVQDSVDLLRYLKAVAHEDREITREVGDARDEMAVARAQTKKVRAVVTAETEATAVRTQQQRALKDRLLASRRRLAGARSRKRHQLVQTHESEKAFIGEVTALQAADARIRARLAAAQAASRHSSVPSSSGLIWPVDGPVTSPFGMRWGRMHQGIDIGASSGAPIRAAAAGTVVYAGWESGYGIFTLIDHGNGLATAYGHQSSLAVSTGQAVARGQVIGYVGCTGHCLGPHVHFEVRVGGSPVDPLGYL